MKTRWMWPAICCAVVLAAIFLANPFNEAGFDDDWSYGRVALKLAQTGRIQYNGFGSPLQLVQSVWAVPWIRLFGFSFPVLQSCTIPISMGFVLLVYATGRQMGLSRQLASFAAIGTGMCPLFLPVAASFMTDSYGCLFNMACIYGALRAADAAEGRDSIRWLWILTAAGIVGGADRQIMWAGPFALILYLAAVRRGERAFAWHAAVAYAVLGISVLTILHFFHPPYMPVEAGGDFILRLIPHRAGPAMKLVLQFLFLLVLLSLPAFCCCLRFTTPRAFARYTLAAAVVANLTMLGIVMRAPFAPYGNNLFTESGISVWEPEIFILPVWVRIFLTFVTNLCIVCAAIWALKRVRENPHGGSRSPLAVFGIFALAYLPLILPGALMEIAYDRYMLPLVPLALLGIMLQVSRRQGYAPAGGWLCLILFAAYGVAITHDYSARLRARVQEAHQLENRGIGRNRISVSVEYDGWTQLEATESAQGTEYRDFLGVEASQGYWRVFWNHTPSLRPDYVVMNWNRPEVPPGGRPPVEYRAWLPPFHRSVAVFARAELTAELEAARLVAMTGPWR